ncbi:helix-turn-helix domain-containing protein [Clostridium perfringens]|uniref:helix-turn-helix domain-containing protein n=1 Tax=Clostridium perfringens TaxID=1502 RepID=UPI0022E7C7D3|nr:helix-turn-helix transcriptional regulator [Clostridium perfringens]MDK0528653.1 helix-turn-helix transcriptional regulator [Clostridium perfringens]MDK0555503.1 helix-turn-helix transcriptional regulator [Clostridium perfringens]MDK0564391.1 helix-turn-helix transcriptional regulator [Clostridium perfringens]MDK0587947.1 helix-turn-helix transcriptional regulator [Clostridium perfringens]MDK0746846.1 helix-turn-helix transcriptional regulator [Clostridium perfringens]
MSTTAYGYYEQVKRSPDPETLNKLSDYFNVSTDYLLGKSDIKESADQLLKDKSTTIALHNSNGIDDELPDEARKEIEDFIEYVKHKYKKQDCKSR